MCDPNSVDKRIPVVRVQKRKGQAFIDSLRAKHLLHRQGAIRPSNGELIIPLTRGLDPAEKTLLRQQLGDFREDKSIVEMRPRQRTLLDYFSGLIPRDLMQLAPRAFDVVGHVAVVEVPVELAAYRGLVGECILRWKSNVRTVLAKAGPVGGEYRVRNFELIAGVDSTETLHREYGCRFLLDLRRVNFNPRLAFERSRVAGLTGEGEIVFDMFSGVGSFAILVARTHRNVTVYASDVNPDAYAYLKKNIELNRVEGKVIPLASDASAAASQELRRRVDRVIMDLPSGAGEFLAAASEALKAEGGMVHLYSFTSERPPFKDFSKLIQQRLEELGWTNVQIEYIRKVKSSAPHEWMVALDVKLQKSHFGL